MMPVLSFFFYQKNGFRTYAFIDSMYKCYKCVHVHMYFRSVKVNGAMSDSQSTEFSQNFSLCGFIAVEQGHARGRVATAVAPAGPGRSPAAGLGRLGALACSSCLTHVLPRALGWLIQNLMLTMSASCMAHSGNCKNLPKIRVRLEKS